MAEWSADENPYHILGVTLETTPDELKKKYRRLVLEKHPDKQPGNKQAAAEFIRIQRAYEVLTDDKAKAAYDALQRAKQAREAKQAGQSEKRRKMAAELERREREFEVERQQEKAARNKLNAELARLRKEMSERENERQAAQLRERVAASLGETATSSNAASSLSGGETQRTLKVSWDATISSYSRERLQEIFANYGPVEDVVVRKPKKKGKGSALIIMEKLQGAVFAAKEAIGDLQNPLLVVPLAKVPSIVQIGSPQDQEATGSAFGASSRPPAPGQASRPSMSSLFPGFSPPDNAAKKVFAAHPGESIRPETAASGPSAARNPHSSFENDILAKMRRKAEQDRKARANVQQPAVL